MRDSGPSSWLSALGVYRHSRIIALLFLGFSSGLPLLLVMGTLAARVTESGASLTTVGFFSLVSFAFGFKFLWSPIVDRLPLPLISSRLGQRRGWILLSQGLCALCMVGLGGSDPTQGLLAPALWAVGLSFAAATQDIAIDAFRVESLPEDEMGAGAGIFVLGYRLGMVVAGGGALILADSVGWTAAYTAMAALMAIGALAILWRPEPDRPPIPPLSDRPQPWPRTVALWLDSAVLAPLREFTSRPGWVLIIAFIAFYKYGDALLSAMATPFYLDIGFTKTEIGLVSKTFGITLTIVGGLVGGVIVARLGIMRSLVLCGILQALSNLVFVVQAMVGNNLEVLMATIAVENLTSGMGAAAFVAYLSSLCNIAYTATQYALVSSLMATARTFLASGGGWLADQMDWVGYFLLSTAAAVPGLALLAWMMYAFPKPPNTSKPPQG